MPSVVRFARKDWKSSPSPGSASDARLMAMGSSRSAVWPAYTTTMSLFTASRRPCSLVMRCMNSRSLSCRCSTRS